MQVLRTWVELPVSSFYPAQTLRFVGVGLFRFDFSYISLLYSVPPPLILPAPYLFDIGLTLGLRDISIDEPS